MKRLTISRWATDANTGRVCDSRVVQRDVGDRVQGRGAELIDPSRDIGQVPQTFLVSLDKVDSASGI